MSDAASMAERVDALLPQTQCTKCGFEGCRPYADAIATGQADINRCPPGGAATIVRLSKLTGQPVQALNPDCGSERPRRVAWIDPERCIGCTRCIPACPVDAIIGAPKFLHAVLASHCTGCDLCLAPCPVDCIEMLPLPADANWTEPMADAARRRHAAHRQRLAAPRVVGRRKATVSAALPTFDPKAEPVDAAPVGPRESAPADAGLAAVSPAPASAAQRKQALLASITERARRNLSQRKPT